MAYFRRPQRRARRVAPEAPGDVLPSEDLLSNLDDAEGEMVQHLDAAHYRDDILRLLFVCCDPVLPSNQQIALALRIVSGLSVKEIARAFLVGEAAMEQRITRAKRKIAESQVPFEAPGAVERAERLAAVATVIYLISTRAIRRAAVRLTSELPCARKPYGWRGFCCGSFQANLRSWG